VTRGDYALIDFGEGRKLESFAGYLVDRPCPAADGIARARPDQWNQIDARFDLSARRWQFRRPWPAQLLMDGPGFVMPLQPTPFGHVGLFPEQQDNWQWLTWLGRQLAAPSLESSQRSPDWGLNLFGYTGASTLAMVAAGLAVAHVDAARPSVQVCRQAAELNGFGDAAIRYLVEDAAKYVQRELRRGRRYTMIALDPPAYGHAPDGRAWRLERDLWPLLENCLQLLGDPWRQCGLLVTGHSPHVDHQDVAEFLRTHRKLQSAWRNSGLNLLSGRSKLTDLQGRHLDAGFFVRWWSLSGSDSIRSDE
jgi:23S rRNA (cytosine1962-C5)-methyltransferase